MINDYKYMLISNMIDEILKTQYKVISYNDGCKYYYSWKLNVLKEELNKMILGILNKEGENNG